MSRLSSLVWSKKEIRILILGLVSSKSNVAHMTRY